MSEPEIITDIWGEAWYVREKLETPHGFELLRGIYGPRRSPAAPRRKHTGGLPKVIVTVPLVQHLWTHALESYEAHQLPISTETIKNLRRQLGISRSDYRDQWWTDRIEDLRSLPIKQFAAKHGVSQCTTSHHKKRLGLSRACRTRQWWDERIEDLRSLAPKQFAARHKVRVTAVHSARHRLLSTD